MTNIPSVLQRIVATKWQEIETAKAQLPLADLQAQASEQHASGTHPRRGFAQALRSAAAPSITPITNPTTATNQVGIIAEIKKASPSKGIISPNFDPIATAKGYQQAGANCLSVLTDVQYFQGYDDYLVAVRGACDLPVLRKDFMVDAYHIYQSYVLGADCVLLIVACLDDDSLHELHGLATQLGMDVLIEMHTANELERALQLPFTPHNIYGINNRDLNTFEVDLAHSIVLKDKLLTELAQHGDEAIVVSESGLQTAQDLRLMQNNGIHHFLIGEQFMKTEQPAQALSDLLTQLHSLV